MAQRASDGVVSSCESFARQSVANQVYFIVGVEQGNFENLVDQVAVSVEFVERYGEQLQLKIEVHPNGTVDADQSGMEGHISVLSFRTRRGGRTAKVDAVLGDENPILIEDDLFEFPVFPSGLPEPYDVRGFIVSPALGQTGQFRAEAFVNEELQEAESRLGLRRDETITAPAGGAGVRLGLPRCGLASAYSATSPTFSSSKPG